MINVQMREEHALDTRRNSSNHVGSAFSYMHLIERHDLSNQPRYAVAAGIGHQLLRYDRIDQIVSELRVSYDVDEDMNRLRAIGQMRRLRGGALQIQQAEREQSNRHY